VFLSYGFGQNINAITAAAFLFREVHHPMSALHFAVYTVCNGQRVKSSVAAFCQVVCVTVFVNTATGLHCMIINICLEHGMTVSIGLTKDVLTLFGMLQLLDTNPCHFWVFVITS